MRKVFAILLMTIFAAGQFHAAAAPVAADNARSALSITDAGLDIRIMRTADTCCRTAQDVPAKASRCSSKCAMSIVEQTIAFYRVDQRPTCSRPLEIPDARPQTVFRPPIAP